MGGIAVIVIGMVVAARYGAIHAKSAAPKTPQAVTVSAKTTADHSPEASRAAGGAAAHTQPPAKAAAEHSVVEKSKSAAAAKPASNMLIVANGPAPAKAPAIAPTAADASHANEAPVTITGCLETTVDENEFRLTDTEGANAPKSRSWKSGFLKKNATPVSLIGFSDPTGLKKLVGHRVSATGMLTSGELRLRSYKAAGASCSN